MSEGTHLVTVPRLGADGDLSGAARIGVDHALWTAPADLPPTDVELGWTDEALVCRMTTAERHPLTRFTEPNDPVHLDSCLEFFLTPWPGEGLYLNLEGNSAGTFYAAFGPTFVGATDERVFLDEHQRGLVGCEPEVGEDSWSITWTVPRVLLDELADQAGRPRLAWGPGLELEANFYKCGDETEREHYGAWSPIEAEVPQFHRPDAFGRLVLG